MPPELALQRPLTGRVVLVTGASRGIGAAAAVMIAHHGAHVALTARTAEEGTGGGLPGSLERTAALVRAAGVDALTVVADLSDPADRARIVDEVEAGLGPVDVLVNNAAAAIYRPASAMALRRARLLFEVNTLAPLELMQAVLPGMRARGWGAVVNVSSRTSDRDASHDGALGTTAAVYGASKAALERLCTAVAVEVGGDGVAVSVVSPVRGVWTEGAAALVGGTVPGDGFEPVEDMAAAITLLAGARPGTGGGRALTSAEVLDAAGGAATSARSSR